jgi:hypothetical protein
MTEVGLNPQWDQARMTEGGLNPCGVKPGMMEVGSNDVGGGTISTLQIVFLFFCKKTICLKVLIPPCGVLKVTAEYVGFTLALVDRVIAVLTSHVIEGWLTRLSLN